MTRQPIRNIYGWRFWQQTNERKKNKCEYFMLMMIMNGSRVRVIRNCVFGVDYAQHFRCVGTKYTFLCIFSPLIFDIANKQTEYLIIFFFCLVLTNDILILPQCKGAGFGFQYHWRHRWNWLSQARTRFRHTFHRLTKPAELTLIHSDIRLLLLSNDHQIIVSKQM